MNSSSLLFFVCVALSIEISSAFVVQRPDRTLAAAPLRMGGFGGGSGSGGGGKKKGKKKAGGAPVKLKAKSQWDRYCDKLKGAKIFPVAVRVVDSDDKGEWLEVGRVKSEGDEFTEIAVAMQRGLIAEHAKRLLPLQVKPKDVLEWGYRSAGDSDDAWTQVDKSVCDEAPKGVEKKLGFEGTPDPNSGFYCHYSGGRLVDKSDEAKQMAKSG